MSGLGGNVDPGCELGLGGKLILIVSFLSFFCVVLRFNPSCAWILMVSFGIAMPVGMSGFWASPEGGGVGNFALGGKLGFGGKGDAAIQLINPCSYFKG